MKIVMKADIEKQMANKELEIEKLNSKIREYELNQRNAIDEAVQKKNEKISLLELELAVKNAETQNPAQRIRRHSRRRRRRGDGSRHAALRSECHRAQLLQIQRIGLRESAGSLCPLAD